MRTFLEPTQLRRVAFIILLGWFIPLTGVLGVTIFSPAGVRDNNVKKDLKMKIAVDSKDNNDSPGADQKSGAAEKGRIASNGSEQETSENKTSPASGDNQVNWDNQAVAATPNNSGADQNNTVKTSGANNTNGKTTNTNSAQTQNGNLNLLARLIHAEARGEPLEGQVAVGAVLLNRLESPRFPNNLWGIIFKKGEFCTVRDGQIWMNPNNNAYRAARLAMSGWDPTNGALYFYNPAKTTSKWIWSRPVTNKIGSHVFAR